VFLTFFKGLKMKRSLSKIAHFKSTVLLCTLIISMCNHGYAFNSEEHKLISDLGASEVKIPGSVNLPLGVNFVKDKKGYLAFLKYAKKLAVGFDTNNENDYNQKKENVQDNCYWSGYGQLAYNKKIRIPKTGDLPTKVLFVPSQSGTAPEKTTLGELVALYGDYRRTTACGAAGVCYLTNTDTPTIGFGRGNVYNKNYYCPDAVSSNTYLRSIGSGLVPPFGTLGNQSSNTADDDEYEEVGWWGDEMIRTANVNDWHFSKVAISWYVGLHRQALYYVNLARTDSRYWVQALHHEANALHALVDIFGLGHMVTNRDESSYGIMKDENLRTTAPYEWMEAIIKQGGASRNNDGLVSLNSKLTTIKKLTRDRNEFLPSYRGNWGLWAKGEQTYHDKFNQAGATVKNLNGDTFSVYGDKKLHSLDVASRSIIKNAVKASIQSLFDAYVSLEGRNSLTTIGAKGSSFFEALKYIPVYIDTDDYSYFLGRWALYANFIDELTGANVVPANWASCKIPFLSGKNWTWPETQSSKCTIY
jgi:hypothetical protein